MAEESALLLYALAVLRCYSQKVSGTTNSITNKEIKITFGYVGVVFFLEYGCIER
jgi:hypothetical protein